MKKAQSVIICGGGIGGLTAAHELASRGFDVTVYERNKILGGLARSETFKNKNGTYPTEYSWRVYGTGYRNLLRILGEIPLRKHPKQFVLDKLVKVTHYLFPRFDKEEVLIPQAGCLKKLTEDFKKGDLKKMIEKTFYCVSMSLERMDSLDEIKWEDFCKDLSPEAKKYMVQLWGPVLGMDTTYMNFPVVARLVGILLSELIGAPGGFFLMNKPTNEAWFDEWSTYLQDQHKVQFKTQHEVMDFKVKNGVIDHIVVKDKKGKRLKDNADYYLCALPVEVISKIVSKHSDLIHIPMFKDIMALGKISRQIQLSVQLFLDQEFIYPTDEQIISYLPDSPWSLIIEPEARVWGRTYSTDPRVKSVLSVGICQTDAPGILHRKPFTKCTLKEIREEVCAQIQKSDHASHIKTKKGDPFNCENIVLFYMWESFKYDKKKKRIDVWEPKFSNNAGSFKKQPTTQTPIPNFFFATGYTKTDRFIYSMESATEAGILASNAIVKAHNKTANVHLKLSKVYRLKRSPVLLKPLVALDKLFFKLGLPHPSKFTFSSSTALVGLYCIFSLGILAALLFLVF